MNGIAVGGTPRLISIQTAETSFSHFAFCCNPKFYSFQRIHFPHRHLKNPHKPNSNAKLLLFPNNPNQKPQKQLSGFRSINLEENHANELPIGGC
jgi:hypothetical protein